MWLPLLSVVTILRRCICKRSGRMHYLVHYENRVIYDALYSSFIKLTEGPQARFTIRVVTPRIVGRRGWGGKTNALITYIPKQSPNRCRESIYDPLILSTGYATPLNDRSESCWWWIKTKNDVRKRHAIIDPHSATVL